MNHALIQYGKSPAIKVATKALTDLNLTLVENEMDADVAIGTRTVNDYPSAIDKCKLPSVLIERGGVGAHSISDVDAAVSVFPTLSVRSSDLRARVGASESESESNTKESNTSGTSTSVEYVAGAIAGQRLRALLEDPNSGSVVIEIAQTDIRQPRVILPTPDGPLGFENVSFEHRSTSLDETLTRAEQAVDPRIGIISQVGERESYPAPYYLARVRENRSFSAVRAPEFAGGVDMNWDVAFMKATGEAFERYCAGTYTHDSFTTAPATTQRNPVSPSQFVTPSNTTPPKKSDPIPWIEGRDLYQGTIASLPAEFVFHPPPRERLRPAITTGLGVGTSPVEAALSGVCEVVERDAAMISWYSTYDPLGLNITSDDTFEALRNRANSLGLSVQPLLLTQDIDIPVVAVALYREETWPHFAVGSNAAVNAIAAANGALAEALQNWMELRSMGSDEAENASGAIGQFASFPEPAHEFIDVEHTVPIHTVGSSTELDKQESLANICEQITAAGMSVYAARITTADVSQLGFEALRVLIPSSQPLFQDTTFFGKRAEEVPKSLGFEPHLDRVFHPYP
jgi:ribosomal protein S12 methylthiotransferase accessory factor